jgi:hypothetical protein
MNEEENLPGAYRMPAAWGHFEKDRGVTDPVGTGEG